MLRKCKDTILNVITSLAAVSFLFFASCIDSPSWIPTIICFASASWIVVFAYVKTALMEGEEE